MIAVIFEVWPAEGRKQTYLDIGQGNRVSETLYDRRLPSMGPMGSKVPHWPEIVDRADSAPADIVPGLLAATLRGGPKEDGRTVPAAAAGTASALSILRSEPGRVNLAMSAHRRALASK